MPEGGLCVCRGWCSRDVAGPVPATSRRRTTAEVVEPALTIRVGGPSYDAALGLVLLRRGTGGAREVIRVFNPEPTAGFSRRDQLRPGFAAALRLVRERGFEPVLRGPGGRFAVYHRGSVVVDHVCLEPGSAEGMQDRFEHYAEMHAEILRGLGLDARIGEVPGEYCPGKYSVNAGA